MLRLPFYGKTKLLLAFEYGVLLSETAKEQKIELNKEMMKKAEDMILNEFHKDKTRISVETLPNILSIFETK